MMTGLFTIGNDPQLKTIEAGKGVISLSLACDVGWGENKRTAWYSTALWEKRATALAPYLVKGQQVYCVLDDVELDEYPKSDGTTGEKIKARLVDIKLTRGEKSGTQGTSGVSKPAAKQSEGFDYDDTEVPF